MWSAWYSCRNTVNKIANDFFEHYKADIGIKFLQNELLVKKINELKVDPKIIKLKNIYQCLVNQSVNMKTVNVTIANANRTKTFTCKMDTCNLIGQLNDSWIGSWTTTNRQDREELDIFLCHEHLVYDSITKIEYGKKIRSP